MSGKCSVVFGRSSWVFKCLVVSVFRRSSLAFVGVGEVLASV